MKRNITIGLAALSFLAGSALSQPASAAGPTMAQTVSYIHDHLLGATSSVDPILSRTITDVKSDCSFITITTQASTSGVEYPAYFSLPTKAVGVHVYSNGFFLICNRVDGIIPLCIQSISQDHTIAVSAFGLPLTPALRPRMANAVQYLQQLCAVQQ